MSQTNKVYALTIGVSWNTYILIHSNRKHLSEIQALLADCTIYDQRGNDIVKTDLIIQGISDTYGTAVTIADAMAKLVGTDIIKKEWIANHEAIEVFSKIPAHHVEEVEKVREQHNKHSQ